MTPAELARLADRLETSLKYLERADTDVEAAEAWVQEARDQLLLAIARHLAAGTAS